MINRLKKGDEIEIVAPSSFIDNEEAFTDGIKILQEWDLKIKKNDILSRKFGYFAGNDEIRFNEIRKAQNSKFIVFAKGGWGSSRLLEHNLLWGDGWMLGFSDTCSLLLSKYSKGSLGSIHGPMLTTLSSEPEWSIERLRDFLFEGHVEDIQGIPLKDGIANGQIIVSNLTIACFLIGTEHFPDLKGKIVIFEDINEEIYKIDRMLSYLRISKKLDNIAGIGFGNFFNEIEKTQKEEIFIKLIYERLSEYNIPLVFNLPVGHISGNACIPLGYYAILNGNKGTLSIKTIN